MTIFVVDQELTHFQLVAIAALSFKEEKSSIAIAVMRPEMIKQKARPSDFVIGCKVEGVPSYVSEEDLIEFNINTDVLNTEEFLSSAEKVKGNIVKSVMLYSGTLKNMKVTAESQTICEEHADEALAEVVKEIEEEFSEEIKEAFQRIENTGIFKALQKDFKEQAMEGIDQIQDVELKKNLTEIVQNNSNPLDIINKMIQLRKEFIIPKEEKKTNLLTPVQIMIESARTYNAAPVAIGIMYMKGHEGTLKQFPLAKILICKMEKKFYKIVIDTKVKIKGLKKADKLSKNTYVLYSKKAVEKFLKKNK